MYSMFIIICINTIILTTNQYDQFDHHHSHHKNHYYQYNYSHSHDCNHYHHAIKNVLLEPFNHYKIRRSQPTSLWYIRHGDGRVDHVKIYKHLNVPWRKFLYDGDHDAQQEGERGRKPPVRSPSFLPPKMRWTGRTYTSKKQKNLHYNCISKQDENTEHEWTITLPILLE